MTDPHANVVLMGLRASGKTTIGRRLSERLARPFVDLDHITRASFAETGSISEIWRRVGEARWRSAETLAIERTLQTPGQVIASGGGTPASDSVRTLLLAGRDSGAIVPVYLQCRTEVLQARLRQEQDGEAGDRPPLLGHSAIEEVPEVLAVREPLYQHLASITVDANDDLETVLERLVRALQIHNRSPAKPSKR